VLKEGKMRLFSIFLLSIAAMACVIELTPSLEGDADTSTATAKDVEVDVAPSETDSEDVFVIDTVIVEPTTDATEE
tara:strand:- start:339 stop:566 length:228 start_codon:yes stop_codon:yes gene_type:complete